MNLSIELKTRIYEHIGQVRNHLGAFAVDEQREILESIETHIHDALESRSEGEPTMDLLEAIVAELDPPESYGPAPSSTIPKTPQPKRLKRLSLILLLAAGTATAWMLLKQDKDISKPNPDAKPAPAVVSKPEPPIVGHWTSIDFVPEIKAFDPDKRTWQGALELKELVFRPDGSTSKPGWTWKGSQLFHSGNQSQANFSIVTITRQKYLFLEWLPEDVLNDDKKPGYYVFIRGSYIDPSEPKIITEGVGWGVVRLGASAEEVTEYLGTPESGGIIRTEPGGMRTQPLLRWTRWPIKCTVNKDHHVASITFDSEFNGQTSKGIKMGSSEQEVLDAYGQPSEMEIWESQGIRKVGEKGVKNTETMMWWRSLGLRIFTRNGKVYLIEITKPQ